MSGGPPDVLWPLLAFFLGALPFSPWLGRIGSGRDIRAVGDGNPGASNVFAAAGRRWGTAALALDYLKGVLPVVAAAVLGDVSDGWLAATAVAPVLGHAFSPWLRWRGGKALAVTFGVWTALSLWRVPVIMGGAFALWLWLLKSPGWAVLAGMATVGLAFALVDVRPVWWLVWAANTAVLLWKHRDDLQTSPRQAGR